MISFFLTVKRLVKALWQAFKLKNFQVLFTLVLILLFSGTSFYVKQEGLSIIDALYFCVVTLSTIGHPSFEPQTTFGKVFTILYIFCGNGAFIGLIGYVAYAMIQKPEKRKRNARE
ncbi:potassium channel family protein [Rossellomorea aquimaris]|uniref:potassium channel family protein n=1 Tax=Rossellomorea aquimaris TaxID=189382 RepID=UPI001CD3ACFA|nr:potassium channel family protein [Rossellomorea aquimaris]MCA1060346.1 potassium channel family protein [Rossellomorea aquimaris]